MADEFTYIKLPSDPCLTQDQMTKYIDGKLSVEAQHACEKHMLDCEMCADAVEGLALVTDRSVLTKPLNTEASTVADKGKVIGLNPQRNNKMWYAVAAVLVVVFATTFFINKIANNDESSVTAQSNEAVYDSTVSPAVANEWKSAEGDSPIVSAPGTNKPTQDYRKGLSPTESETNRTRAEQPPVAANHYFSLNEQDGQSGISSGQAEADLDDVGPVLAPVAEEKNDISESVVVEDAVDKETTRKLSFWDKAKIVAPPASNKSRPEQQSLARDENTKDNAGVAQADLKKDEVPAPPVSTASGAAVVTEELEQPVQDSVVGGNQSPHPLKPSDNDLELSYVNGMKLYNSGQYNSSLVFFDEVLKNKTHPRFEDAEFQKANALIKCNRKEEAKTLLKAIELKKGKHAAAATDLLKTL